MDFARRLSGKLRGSRADATKPGAMLLVKNVSALRATYQIRLLTYQAHQTRAKLTVMVPKACTILPSLKSLIDSYPQCIALERM